jgi:hypothetical protein
MPFETAARAALLRCVTGYGDAGHALVTGGVDKVNAMRRTILLYI